jgi:O-methyltransferase involved in polyketide biosynthesis
MKNQLPRINLEPTAAFVIDLAKELFTSSELTNSYFERLDLRSASGLIEGYQRAEIYDLTRELMCNRKYFIREKTLEILEGKQSTDVIILAAGKSPLSLELLDNGNVIEKLGSIFEVDVESFTEKKRVYEELIGKQNRVQFIEADICSPELFKVLKARSHSRSRVVILEGITHYLTFEELQSIVENLATDNESTSIILEFGPPFETRCERVVPIAQKAYEVIEELHFGKPMTKFSFNELENLFNSVGGRITEHATMEKMEMYRTAKNHFFPETNSGWVECVVGTI